jgi:hypothetical protein
VSAVFWDTKAPAFALRDYGLASQARETDGDGAPSLPKTLSSFQFPVSGFQFPV